MCKKICVLLLMCCCCSNVEAETVCVDHNHGSGKICVEFSGNSAKVTSTGKDLSNITTISCSGSQKKDDGLKGKVHTAIRDETISKVCVKSGNNTDSSGVCASLSGNSGGQLVSASADVCKPKCDDPKKDLTASVSFFTPLKPDMKKLCIVFENKSKLCDHKVGVASYEKFDEIIDNQKLFDSEATLLKAKKTEKLCVDVPDCAAQLDWFHGIVLESLNGQRYGARLIGAYHTNNGTGSPGGKLFEKPEHCKVPEIDCMGIPGGGAVVDQCGVCGGDNSTCADCLGVPNGQAVIDECGVCDGDSSTCLDCAGTPNGESTVDQCGVCNGDGASCLDCAGEINGEAKLDACGVCNGDNSSCSDCMGIPWGEAQFDECGDCGGDGSSCADCLGIPNGGHEIDECGVCSGQNLTCLDCTGVPNGDARLDDCGVCNGDGSTCKVPDFPDCFGIPGGHAVVDQCGVCGGNGTSCADCAGKPNGGTIIDACGVCGGDGSSCASCPLVEVPFNITNLIRKARNLANQRTVKYFKRQVQCDAKSKKPVLKKIKRTESLLQDYMDIVHSIPSSIELCPGECVQVVMHETLETLDILNKKILRLANDAQRGARKACKTTDAGNPATVKLSKSLSEDIRSCPTEVCS